MIWSRWTLSCNARRCGQVASMKKRVCWCKVLNSRASCHKMYLSARWSLCRVRFSLAGRHGGKLKFGAARSTSRGGCLQSSRVATDHLRPPAHSLPSQRRTSPFTEPRPPLIPAPELHLSLPHQKPAMKMTITWVARATKNSTAI